MSSTERRLESLFERALRLAPPGRAAFLDAECGGDHALRKEVSSLLAFDEWAGSSLGRQVSFDEPGRELSDPDHPESIGPYRTIKKIGSGGVGDVFLALAGGDIPRPVAVKVIRAGIEDDGTIRRFKHECRALALMEHPHIAGVYDSGVVGGAWSGRPYIVMEYVPGQPINTYCDEHGLSINERIALLIAVCDAVQHAHVRGVIHRDLKPSNVLVGLRDNAAVPKVIDFGVAKLLTPAGQDDNLCTRPGQLIGTPMYMSPEQANLTAGSADARSDVYSLGMIAYELLVGASPYGVIGGSLLDLIRAIQDRPPVPPRRIRPRFPRDLQLVLLKALHKARSERYQSVAALADDFRAVIEHRPISARPPTPFYVGLKLACRRPRMAAAAAVLLIGATALVAYEEARVRASGPAFESAVAAALTAATRDTDPNLDVQTLKKILKDTERSLRSEPARLAQVRVICAPKLFRLGEPKESFDLLNDSLAMLSGDSLSIRRARASVHGTLYRLNCLSHQYEDAHRHMQALYDIAKGLPGFDRYQEMGMKLDLASCCQLAHKVNDARRLIEPMLKSWLDEGEELPASLKSGLAMYAVSIMLEAGERERADRIARTCLRDLQRSSTPSVPLAAALATAGGVLWDQGRYGEALPYLKQSYEMYREVCGPGHEAVAYTFNSWAVCLRDIGQTEEADRLLQNLVQHLIWLHGEHDARVSGPLCNLAWTELYSGKLREAKQHFEQVRYLRDGGPLERAEMAEPLVGLARVALAERSNGMANAAAAVDILKRSLPPNHWRIFEAEAVRAACLKAAGNEASAFCTHEIARRGLRESIGVDHPRAIAALRLITDPRPIAPGQATPAG